MEGKFSKWWELLTDVPQSSVLGPLLFNIYPNYLFYTEEYTDICKFADDTSPHFSSNDIKEAMTNIEHDCTLLVEWFHDNHMTLKASKCCLFVSGYVN